MMEHAYKLLETNPQRRDQAIKAIRTVLRMDEGQRSAAFGRWALSFAKAGFLLVVLGIELDLYGFLMSWTTYWNAGKSCAGGVGPDDVVKTMRLFLLACPAGYFLAIAQYYNQDFFAGFFKQDEIADNRQPLLPQHKGDVDRKQKILVSKPPVILEYFHFLPLLRFYVLAKELAANDVEALFRVSSVSSFTIGFAQLMCFLLAANSTCSEDPHSEESHKHLISVTLIVIFGLCAQFFNLLVTFVYFHGRLPSLMKSSFQVEALIENEKERFAEQDLQYQKYVAQHAETKSQDDLDHVEDMLNGFKIEISQYAQDDLLQNALSYLPYEDITEMVMFVRTKKIYHHQHITSLGS